MGKLLEADIIARAVQTYSFPAALYVYTEKGSKRIYFE